MRSFIRLVVASLALIGVLPGAAAQAFPSKPVKIIVSFSPGSAADLVARRLGQRLSEIWGQGVVIENVAGAGGNIGAAVVAKAPPDGHTLLMLTINHVINPALYKDVGYDIPRDFRPIVRVAVAPLAIIASPKFGPSSIQGMVAAAKSKPGDINYGSGGNGSITHLAVEMLNSQTGIKTMHVPYKSIAPMLTGVLGEQVQIAAPALASVISHAKAGTLKVLAVTTIDRSSLFPNVPTIAESGVPGYDVSTWNGLAAPLNTPNAIVEKIHTDVLKVAQSVDFRNELQQQAIELKTMGPAEFGAFVKMELDKWALVVKQTGAKLD